MALLAEPNEFLDLAHGDAIRIRVSKYEEGEAQISPRSPSPRQIHQYMEEQGLTSPPAPGAPIKIKVPVLRIWITRLDKPSHVPYYDISSKILQAALLPLLRSGAYKRQTYTITAEGTKPLKRYSLEVS